MIVKRKLFLLLPMIFVYTLSIAQYAAEAEKLKAYVFSHKDKLGVTDREAENLSVTHAYTDAGSGIQHIYAIQKLNGLAITNTSFGLHIKGSKELDANRLISYKSYTASGTKPSITATEAIHKVMKEINYPHSDFQLKEAATGTDHYTVFKRNESRIWDIPVRLVYYNNSKMRSLIAAWEVQMMDVQKHHYWMAFVDANTGAILEKRDLIKHCNFDNFETDKSLSEMAHPHTATGKELAGVADPAAANSVLPLNQYRVYDMPYESPVDPGAAHLLSNKSGDNLASPDGWHKVNGAITYNYARGNNVWAFQDPSPGPLGGVPSSDPSRTAYPTNTIAGVPPVVEPFVFDYPVLLDSQPKAYQNAAIVNLFYWNNLIHDVFYQLGFTEASGNFQESHTFSSGTKSGGNPGDAVWAQAQDGGGTNNANFLTLTDGINGQMQMYLWTTAKPDSLVRIESSSVSNPTGGRQYIAIQGSLNALPTGSTNLYTNPVINKQLVLVKKPVFSVVGTDEEGCTSGQQSVALPPANDVSGKIAVVRRGNCSFVEKVLSAQQGGAVGVIIVNNVPGPPMPFGGSDAPGNLITIPAVMIRQSEGDVLISKLKAGASIFATLKRDSEPDKNRDGDLDNGVIAHEYGHGISNRLTGGSMSTLPLGGDEEGGEGWSDYIALYLTLRKNDIRPATVDHPNGVLPTRSIGNYVTYQPYNGRGIRHYPYSTNMSENPATFAFIKRPEYAGTHSVGFVWCSMMYEMLQLFIDKYGIGNNVYNGAEPDANGNPPATAKGNNIAMRLIIDGMKLQPTSPTFIEERDAILKADTLLYNGQHGCLIWEAFAKRGLGYSAISGTNALGDETESFDVPLACKPDQKRVKIVKQGPVKVDNNTKVRYNITVTNKYTTKLTNIVVTDTLPPGVSFVSATKTPVVNGNVLTWTFNLIGNASINLQVVGLVNVPSASTLKFGTTHDDSTAFTPMNLGGVDTWALQNDSSKAFSGSRYWFVPDTDAGGSNTTLSTTSPVSVPANAELVFIHKYASESEFDGGIVEISENNIEWKYLPPNKFVQNGYNSIIPLANTPVIGTEDRAAFSGASPGYVVSIAKLDEYAGKNIYIRFRFVADVASSVPNGGWWMDDVYMITNRVSLTNRATAVTVPGETIRLDEGTNAVSVTTAFVMDGATGSRPIETVARPVIAPEKVMKATIYPNPADNIANISIDNPAGGNVTITLFDVSGKNLGTFKAGALDKKSIALPVSGLKPGTYWVQVDSEDQHKTLRFIKK